MTDALIERIGAQGSRLALRVLDGLYEDPFWDRRYGARGRRHAEEDSRYHVQYLLEALRTNDAEVMVRYARWLRTVLVSRGMCSAHLAENFGRLGALLTDELADAEPAVAMLTAARAALAYSDGPAGSLDGARSHLSAQAARGQTPAVHHQIFLLISYLSDSLAAARPAYLTAHLRWRVQDEQALAPMSASTDDLVNALSAALGATSEPWAGQARNLLQEAWRAATTARADAGHR